MFHFDDESPIYSQLATQLEELILAGRFKAGEQVPSTTQLSSDLHINPATVLKGMNQLVSKGLLEKKRGRGMFVTKNAQEMIRQRRKDNFYDDFVESLVREALSLGLSEDHLISLIKRGYQHEKDAN